MSKNKISTLQNLVYIAKTVSMGNFRISKAFGRNKQRNKGTKHSTQEGSTKKYEQKKYKKLKMIVLIK